MFLSARRDYKQTWGVSSECLAQVRYNFDEMLPTDSSGNAGTPVGNLFGASHIEAVLCQRCWLADNWRSAVDSQQAEIQSWLERAATLLGPQATDLEALANLLSLVFQYDAHAILATVEAHTVLAREGAREVIRDLAYAVLEGAEVDSDHFKEIVTALKEKTGRRSRELFHPLRLALAGRAGEGELDRVILLLDAAAKLPFAVPVKNVRQRMLEFCAALD